MANFEMKNLELTKSGKRQVKLCNGLRAQLFNKVKDVLAAQGFDVAVAANGDLAFPVALDNETGKTFYFRLAASFTDKDLNSKTERKVKEKVVTEVPDLFASDTDAE